METEKDEALKRLEEAVDQKPYTINYERALNKLPALPPEDRKNLLPHDERVPLSVYIDGERQWIGSAMVSGGGGSISLFTGIPEAIKREFNNGLWEVVLTPRETIKLPQKTQLAQEDDR